MPKFSCPGTPLCSICRVPLKPDPEGRFTKYCREHAYGKMVKETVEGVKLGLTNREIALALNRTRKQVELWAMKGLRLNLFTNDERKNLLQSRPYSVYSPHLTARHHFVPALGQKELRCWICGVNKGADVSKFCLPRKSVQ